MSIVTRTGDAGMTTLMYNRQVSKCDPRVEAYGTIDELNTVLGLARASAGDPWIRDRLRPLQGDLVTLMGELATHSEDLDRYAENHYSRITSRFTAELDQLVQEIESQGVSPHGWATPGASLGSATLDLARTVCRRAERRVCALHESGQLQNSEIIIYLNRLSDLLWLLARRTEAQSDRLGTQQ